MGGYVHEPIPACIGQEVGMHPGRASNPSQGTHHSLTLIPRDDLDSVVNLTSVSLGYETELETGVPG